MNWRFCGQEIFQSWEFSIFLIITNLSLLALFFFTRWTRPSGLSGPAFLIRLLEPYTTNAQRETSTFVTPSFLLTTVLSSMMVGILCARSLHYQFYAYIVWATPYLLWKSGLHPVLVYTVWAVQELAWNIYPSTDVSSVLVVGCLAVQVFGVWYGTRQDFADVRSPIEAEDNKHEHSE